jgi:aminoglycoside 3-N-acetyltransferase
VKSGAAGPPDDGIRRGVSDAIGALLARLGNGPVFVHSDPFRAARLVPRASSRDALLDSHLALLADAVAGRPIWMPAFNYNFPRTKIFNVAMDPAQVGPIPEHFRVSASGWRTGIPIFSATGTGVAPSTVWGEGVDPFGAESLFARIVEADGTILYYGDTFHYNTIVHYAERVAGGPPYRYDKLFRGTVITPNGAKLEGSLNYHVRPLGMGLDYDWPAILSRAVERGTCVRLDPYPEILAARAATLTDFLVDEMKTDPLGLLDRQTRMWVEPALQQLGRRFAVDDFEGPDAGLAIARDKQVAVTSSQLEAATE